MSLVLSVAIATLWLRSYFARDQVPFGTRSCVGAWTSRTGSAGVGWGPRLDVPMGAPGWAVLPPSIVVPEGRSWAGLFDVGVKRRGPVTSVVLPHWALMAICLVLPVRWLRGRRVRRPSEQRCPACGYDLRGTLAPEAKAERQRVPGAKRPGARPAPSAGRLLLLPGGNPT
jgi:hypothetical protein